MKHAKRIRIKNRPVVTLLALLSIAASGLPLVNATVVKAADYTQEDIDRLNSITQESEYEKDFDTSYHWDGSTVSPEEADKIFANAIKPTQSTTDPFAPVPNENHQQIQNKIFKLKGVVSVNEKSASFVGLFSFSSDGNIGIVKNRALANDTPWFTDKYREYNGHFYYRVATNEWVKDTNVTEFVAK